MKNVIALATGLGDGLGLGENARAALITRGLAEITRLGVALGAVADDSGRAQRPRRPGPHLHGEPLAQPGPRHGPGAGPFAGRGARGHAHGGRRRSHRPHGAGPGPRVPASACRSARRWGPCSSRAGRPREALAALLARAATREDAPRTRRPGCLSCARIPWSDAGSSSPPSARASLGLRGRNRSRRRARAICPFCPGPRGADPSGDPGRARPRSRRRTRPGGRTGSSRTSSRRCASRASWSPRARASSIA